MSIKGIFYLDSGHSKIIAGDYKTAPDKMHRWSDGSFIFEGEFNAQVEYRVQEALDLKWNIPYVSVAPEHHDVSLATRVNRANTHWKSIGRPPACYVSIHANAGGGIGAEIFTSPGTTGSDKYADVFFHKFARTERMRTDVRDGDLDKEANFYVLRKTYMPAVLIECGFMDRKEDFLKLTDPDYRDVFANHIVDAIVEIYKKLM